MQLSDGTFRYASRGFDVPEHMDVFPHTLLSGGQKVLAAGEGFGQNGVVKYLNRRSGHYQPNSASLAGAVKDLVKNGFAGDTIVVDDSLEGARSTFKRD